MNGLVEKMEISKSILGEELFNPDQNFNENNAAAPEAGTDVQKPVEKTWTLSESGSSDDDEEEEKLVSKNDIYLYWLLSLDGHDL